MRKIDVISSRNNPTVIKYSKLKDKKFRDRELLFAAEGVKLSREALRFSEVESLLVREGSENAPEIGTLIAEAEAGGVAVLYLAEAAFEKISTESAPQGVIAAVRYDRVRHCALLPEHTVPGERILMLCEIMDPGNLGTVLRTAAAFGFGAVIVSGCADIYSPKAVRASMGAVFKMNVYSGDALECIAALKAAGRRVFAAALTDDALTLGDFELRDDDVFVIGNEGHGLSSEVLAASDSAVMIPIAPDTESLNAAVAAAIFAYSLRERTRLLPLKR